MSRPFEPDEQIVLVDSKGRQYLVVLVAGGEFHTHTGVVPHFSRELDQCPGIGRDPCSMSQSEIEPVKDNLFSHSACVLNASRFASLKLARTASVTNQIHR